MPTQKFRVRGIDHESEAMVEARLMRIGGVLFAAVSHQEECAEVEFEDDRVTPAEIREVIRGLGYGADEVG